MNKLHVIIAATIIMLYQHNTTMSAAAIGRGFSRLGSTTKGKLPSNSTFTSILSTMKRKSPTFFQQTSKNARDLFFNFISYGKTQETAKKKLHSAAAQHRLSLEQLQEFNKNNMMKTYATLYTKIQNNMQEKRNTYSSNIFRFIQQTKNILNERLYQYY